MMERIIVPCRIRATEAKLWNIYMIRSNVKTYLAFERILADCQHVSEGRGLASYNYLEPYKVSRTKSNRKAMNRIWGNREANTAPKTKTGNK